MVQGPPLRLAAGQSTPDASREGERRPWPFGQYDVGWQAGISEPAFWIVDDRISKGILQ